MNSKIKYDLSLTFYPTKDNNIHFPFWIMKFYKINIIIKCQ